MAGKKRRIQKKLNRPHRCSGCGQVGHRIETCPSAGKASSRKRKPPARIQRKNKKSSVYKKVPYAAGENAAKPVHLKDTKQKPLEYYMKMKNKQVLRELNVLGLLRHRKKATKCWRCGSKLIHSPKSKTKLTCSNRKLCRWRTESPSTAWTLFYHWARGGHDIHKKFLLALYTMGLKIPPDAAQHIIGSSYDTTEQLFKMIKVALAFAELHRGRSIEFPAGTLEFDGTATNISRAQYRKYNVHCGRFLVVYHRESKTYALEPMPDCKVKKGSAPPPESIADVLPTMERTIKASHLVSSDSAKSFSIVIKKHLKIKDVPHITVVHKNKEFAKLVTIPLSSLPEELRSRAVAMSTSTKRMFRAKAGDQGAEFTFSAIKRNLARMSLLKSSSMSAVNFLAASWVKHEAGIASVARGVKVYQDAMMHNMDPAKMFKDTTWMSSIEPMGE